MGAAIAMDSQSSHFRISRDVPAGEQARRLRNEVRHALENGERTIAINCEAWDSFDFNTVSALVQCAAACREHSATFEVANLSSKLRADLHALQLEGRLGLSG